MKKFSSILSIILLFVGAAVAQTGNIIIPAGHTQTVKQILLDKQEKYMYTLEDRKVIMWDVKSHIQLYTFDNEFYEMSLSHDGTKILVGPDCYSTVTGKLLFHINKGKYSAFAMDDTKIYSTDSGIIITDVATKKQQVLLQYKTDYTGHIYLLDIDRLLISNEWGWIIWNIPQQKNDFAFQYPAYNVNYQYVPNLHCMVDRSTRLAISFLDIYTGNLLKKMVVKEGSTYVMPSVDDKKFIFFNDDFLNKSYKIYNGETWALVKQFTYNDGMSGTYYQGGRNLLYMALYRDVALVDTKTMTPLFTLKRQVANFGSEKYCQLEYNHDSGVMNMITDDSVLKSINMVKLKPFRHKAIPNMYKMAFSATGDTIAVFTENSFSIKSLSTGKLLLPAKKLIDQPSGTEKDEFFFNKAGTHLYYTTFSIPQQRNTLNRINIKTGLIEKVIVFRGTRMPIVSPDKDMLIAFEEDYKYSHARVWSIATGRIIFDKDLGEDNYDYITVSKDKKKVLMVINKKWQTYDLATGKLLSTTEPFILGDVFGSTPDLSLLFNATIYGMLRAVDANGKILYDIKAHQGPIRRIFFSDDASLMYTVSEDGTVKVWLPQTGKLLGTLYLFNDSNDFVFIDPFGRFDGSEGGIKRMYYFRDRIKVNLDVVYEKFYTPNLYQRLINGEQFPPIDIIINPQPRTKISYAQVVRNLNVVDDKIPAFANTTGVAEITVNASAENDKIDEIRLFHNGKIVNLATRGLFVTDNTTGTDTKKYTLNLLPGVNNIRAIALNGQRTESEPDEITVTYNSGGQTNVPAPVNKSGGIIDAIDRNATMHLVVVGINAYKNSKMSLNYALADATAFKDAAELDAKSIITSVKTYFVTDEKADKSGIIAAFTEVQKNAKPQDVFVFYYAGHGVISEKNKEFYLVPNDVTDLKNVDEALEEHGIPSKILQQYAINIAAQKQVFILDACQSAGAFATLLANDANQQKSLAVVARSTGTHWIAASGSQQFANEFSQLGHGAFTYVLLKAMKGEAANNKMVTINGLKNFLQVQVPDLMKKYNGTPQYPSSYGLGNDFPVGVIK